MELTLFLVVFIVVVLMVGVFYPVSGHYEMKKLRKQLADGDVLAKNRFFLNNIIWSWVPVVVIAILMAVDNLNFRDLGFTWINIDTSTIGRWVVYPVIGLYAVYLLYAIYSIFLFKYHKEGRAKAAQSIPEELKTFLPITPKEKRSWTFVSISAGLTEEIVYRGYIFYALSVIFPALSLMHILLISTAIFGIGHVYLGKEAIKSTVLGFFFGLFYIVFGSLIPVIIIHMAQDLMMRDILE